MDCFKNIYKHKACLSLPWTVYKQLMAVALD